MEAVCLHAIVLALERYPVVPAVYKVDRVDIRLSSGLEP